MECEDFASALAEKIKRLSREGHGRDRVSLNYRSFMFGKLPPPACPGQCYNPLIGQPTGDLLAATNQFQWGVSRLVLEVKANTIG